MRRTTHIRRTICAAMAALLLCTACGEVGENKPAPSDNGTPAAASEADETASDTSTSAVYETTESVSETEAPAENAERSLLSSFADFSGKLLKTACEKDIVDGKNVLVSPESVLTALGMTANGAEGETLAAMQNVLAGGADIDAMNKQLGYLSGHIPSTDKVKVNTANAIWANETSDFAMSPDFVEKVRQAYGAECQSKKFDPSIINEVNGWVNEKTDKMIPSILPDMSDDEIAAMRAVLVNAVAFDAKWEEESSEYDVFEDVDFTNSKGETEKCTLFKNEVENYFHDGDAQAFIKPYAGEQYAFMGILPNKGTSVSDYISKLDGERWYALWDSRTDELTESYIPEFKYDYSNELCEHLCEIGMDIAFTNAADFSGMDAQHRKAVKISYVFHKTHIEVDRKGTKAAAATAVVNTFCDSISVGPMPHIIKLDRPFIYAIVDVETGFPVFLGAVNTVKS